MKIPNNFDPYKSIRRIEQRMRRLKMQGGKHQEINGLGYALMIIQDEIKAQKTRKPATVTHIGTPNNATENTPWEQWWHKEDQPA